MKKKFKILYIIFYYYYFVLLILLIIHIFILNIIIYSIKYNNLLNKIEKMEIDIII